MTFHLPIPHLTKLPPTPHWSMPSALPPPLGHAAALTPRVGTAAGLAAVPAPWGVCEIVLAAERTPGATHKFFHDWRFEAVMRHGDPDPGTVLAASPIAPTRRQTVAAVAAPVALVAQFGADAANPRAPLRATFTWTLPPNQADPDPTQPLVLALSWLRQQLGDAGWQPDDASATRYQKPAPAGHGAGETQALTAARAGLDLATAGAPHGVV
jgi:hypothetical protein